MATLPVYRTWVAGEIVTAAFMNTNIRDAGNFLIAVPLAELRQTTIQSIATGGTGAALLFDTEDLDTDNGHSTVTNTSRYTGQTPGVFQFAGGYISAGTTGRREAWWRLNGTDVNGSEAGMFAGAQPSGPSARTKHIALNGSTDFVELIAFQDSAGAISTTVGTTGQPSMSVRWVHT